MCIHLYDWVLDSTHARCYEAAWESLLVVLYLDNCVWKFSAVKPILGYLP